MLYSGTQLERDALLRVRRDIPRSLGAGQPDGDNTVVTFGINPRRARDRPPQWIRPHPTICADLLRSKSPRLVVFNGRLWKDLLRPDPPEFASPFQDAAGKAGGFSMAASNARSFRTLLANDQRHATGCEVLRRCSTGLNLGPTHATRFSDRSPAGIGHNAMPKQGKQKHLRSFVRTSFIPEPTNLGAARVLRRARCLSHSVHR